MPHTYPPDTGRDVPRDAGIPQHPRCPHLNITDLTAAPSATESAVSSRTPEGHVASIKPSRWNTPEFYFYYLMFVIVVPYMVYVPMRISRDSHPNFEKYAHYLRPGWMAPEYDNSDIQYRLFREQLGLVVGLASVYAVAGYILRVTTPPSMHKAVRTAFLGISSAVFLGALHGINALKLAAIVAANYVLVKTISRVSTKVALPVMWVFNCALLFTVFYTDGMPFRMLAPHYSWLDEYAGLLPRWYISYNFSMLRLVSFASDYCWATDGYDAVSTSSSASNITSNAAGNTAGGNAVSSTARERSSTPRPLSEYSLTNALVYALYPPLFVAGPIVTFNDFSAQLERPLNLRIKTVAMYAGRVAISLLTMEFILHYIHVNAIKNAHAWRGDTPLELCMIGFWSLVFVWLKLMLPWRLFRLWALMDGVDTPENMIRCVANNYSTLAFWRSWHRSYNLWVVRYIYVPVGGSRNLLPAALLVFTFVALWHDLSFTLLAWAWLVTLFIAPEVIAARLLPASKYEQHGWYRHVCAVGAVFNILMMMTANLVGFVVGVDGVQELWAAIVHDWNGILTLLGACICLFIGAQLMFEYREEERRRGIFRRC
ncbi:glycerol transporter [Malassezia cuniculi]|uniref:Glycerol transporter n=1 Tax=Malassezia cuniculi TaxID=948313 RepID=A0AAF0J842_9BASI|nr:glycerol transporter [Malassezia cuniculi]